MREHQGFEVAITGAAEGIGRGCVDAFCKAGTKTLIINDLPENSNKLCSIPWAEGRGRVCVDVFTHKGREKLRPSLDRVTTLVCNPYRTIQKPILDYAPGEFEHVIEGTLVSHFYLAQMFAQNLIERKVPGCIIFISSVYASLTRENSVAYDVAKAGIEKMTRTFALELAPYGIRVNAIAPGFTDTPGEHKLASDDEIAKIVNALPLGRACLPEDIGNAAVFLASNPMITGQVITIDGGMSLPSFRT